LNARSSNVKVNKAAVETNSKCTQFFLLISKSSVRITRETSAIILAKKLRGLVGGPLLVGGLPLSPLKSGTVYRSSNNVGHI